MVVASRDIGVWITTSLVPFMVLLSLLNLTAATQDIATDGLAVSRLALRLRGLGQQRAGEIGTGGGRGVLLVLVMPPSAFPCATPGPSSVVRL